MVLKIFMEFFTEFLNFSGFFLKIFCKNFNFSKIFIDKFLKLKKFFYKIYFHS